MNMTEDEKDQMDSYYSDLDMMFDDLMEIDGELFEMDYEEAIRVSELFGTAINAIEQAKDILGEVVERWNEQDYEDDDDDEE